MAISYSSLLFASIVLTTALTIQGLRINEQIESPMRGQPIFRRMRRVAVEPGRRFARVIFPSSLRQASSEYSPQFHGPIKREGPPFVFLHSMGSSSSSTPSLQSRQNSRSGRRLVLTLPKDEIQVLNAEAALSDSGSSSPFLPTGLTLSLRDNDDDDSQSESQSSRYGGTTRTYSSQIPSPPRQTTRFQYGYMDQDSYEQGGEEITSEGRQMGWGHSGGSYDLGDLLGSSGGHVTIIKAQKAEQPKVIRGTKLSSSVKPLKAIIIEPKQVEAKRVRLLPAKTEKIGATKARLIKQTEPVVAHVVKAKVQSGSYKKHSPPPEEDWAASSLHFVSAKPPFSQDTPRQRDEDLFPVELQCGGTNDLGWCDLGSNYPSTEVSQIMEVCDELVSRMYVEIPEDIDSMEDIVSYSLSRNISEQGPRAFWPWKEELATPLKRSLCETQKEVIRPSFAQDIHGKWYVIIQTREIPQRIAVEVCKTAGEPCNSSELCSRTTSQCVQKYTHQQLISFDPESAETCPYVRLYKFPTSCVCRTS